MAIRDYEPNNKKARKSVNLRAFFSNLGGEGGTASRRQKIP